MDAYADLTGESLRFNEDRTLRVIFDLREADEAPYVSVGYLQDSEPIIKWFANGVTDRIALGMIAASAREIEVWRQERLTVPGQEFRREGPPPCISLATDFGGVTFRATGLLGNVYVAFEVLEADDR